MTKVLTTENTGINAVATVAKGNGGFGQDVSTALTNDQVAIVAGNAITVSALTVNAIPSAIPATKIGAGTVDNTEFGYLDGVTSAIQTQLNSKASTTDTRLPPTPTGAGKIIYDNGTAYVEAAAGTTSQVLLGGTTPAFGSVPAAALPNTTVTAGSYPTAGSISSFTVGADGRLTAAGSVTNGSALTTLNASNLTTGVVAETQGGLGSDTSALVAGLITKTAANTYVSRTLSSGTGTTVTNGAGTAGNPSINVTYGTGSNTATQGNDVRLSPAPSVAGKMIYDTGSAYAALTAGTTSQVLIGGTAPAFGSVPDAALSSNVVTLTGTQVLTNKTISGASNTLTNIGNGSLTNSSLTVTAGTGLSGGGVVSLGGSVTLTPDFGTASGKVTQGNDSRLPPTPSVAGKVIYDNGTAYVAAAAGTSSQVLLGGTTPAFGSVPAAALPNTTVVAGAYPTAGSISSFTVGADGRLTAAGSVTNGSALTTLNASNLTTGVVAETQGGLGSDTSALTTGLLTKTAANTYVLRTLSSGTGTTVTNGAGTAGNPSVNVTYGTTSSTATQGNDTRLPPAPTAAGKVLYDTGSAYAETAAGTSNQILVSAGAGSPTWGTRGGAVISFVLNTGQSFAANGYIGLAGDGSSTVNVNVTPWRAPAAGTLTNLVVYSFTNAPSTLHCLIYKATTASTSPTYSATTLDVTVTSGTNIGIDTTHSVSVNAGDLIVAFCNTAWAANGASISVMYSPT